MHTTVQMKGMIEKTSITMYFNVDHKIIDYKTLTESAKSQPSKNSEFNNQHEISKLDPRINKNCQVCN